MIMHNIKQSIPNVFEKTYAQSIIFDRIYLKKHPDFECNSYDVHGDSYADYVDEPYGDYYDTNSEEPN